MSINYGYSKTFEKTGKYACRQEVVRGTMGDKAAYDIGERWRQFAEWAREHGVTRTERVTQELVREYGMELADRVREGEIKAATAQVYLSAVNTVMTICRGSSWESVRPVHDCGIPQRDAVRHEAPHTLDRQGYHKAVEAIRERYGERIAATVGLMRECGMRSREALLADARELLRQAERDGIMKLDRGTKGGRPRIVAVGEREIEALRAAAAVQPRGSHSMLVKGERFGTVMDVALRGAREIMREMTGDGLHDLRAAWAMERYREAMDSGLSEREARQSVAEDLGHGRTEVLKAYLAGI